MASFMGRLIGYVPPILHLFTQMNTNHPETHLELTIFGVQTAK